MRNIKLLFAIVFLLVACVLSAQVSSNITLETEILPALGVTLDIKVVGNLAFISGSEYVLMCFDVSNPAQPQLLSYAYRIDDMPIVPNLGDYGKLLLLGNYAYFYLMWDTVAICDISNPNNISWLDTTVQIPDFNRQITVSGDNLYIAGGPQDNISIWNIANPLNPQLLSTYDFSYAVLDVQVADDYAYVAHLGSNSILYYISILDVICPTDPQLISTTVGGGDRLLCYNGYIYAHHEYSDYFNVLDVSNPSQPVWGNTVSIPNIVFNIDWLVESGVLYLRCDDAQIGGRNFHPLARYDLSNPALPMGLAPFTCSYAYNGHFDVENNRLFMTDAGQQTIIYAPANDSTMVKVGEIQRSSNLNAEQVNGYLYLNNGYIVNCSQPTAQPHYFGDNYTMTSDGTSLFSASGATIYKWNLTQPETPVQIAEAGLWNPENNGAGPLSIVGDYLYSNMFIINTNLDYSSSVYNAAIGNPKKIITYGSYAYAAYADGMRIFEVSDPTNPQLVYTMNMPNGISDIHIVDSTLFIANYSMGLYIYSLSNPELPALIVVKPNVIGIYSIKNSGHYLITAGSQGITVISIYNLAAPEQTGYYYQEGDMCWDMEVVGEQLFVCQGNHLGVYNITAAVSNPTTPELPQTLVSISNYPNPFASTTTIEISGKVDNSPCEIDIYNLKGQKVKSLHAGALFGDTQNLIWDGRDELGTPVADGIYLYRFTQKGASHTKRMLKVK
ncbi:MAG: T9SS type A sorting domain-containing protein [Candidatus Cloacimonetes bacterium]|nr:T9SS type A sorting domain-containing protein [Candidatus Cloacimonadota bacterium]MDD3234745.1 T9SS type A sorting domain-containing protein [Candidatus Cloacimonadota bacterium]